MTDEQFVQLAAVLLSIDEKLSEIRDALAATDADATDACAHPEDKRVSLSTLSDPDHWICRDCQHEHQGFVKV